MTYCSDVQQYEITNDTLKTAVNKIHLGKSLSRDLLIGYWLKKLTFYIEPLANLYQNIFEKPTTLPDWLTLVKTIFLLKNEHTHAVKNYQPIACLNLTYKFFTSCSNNFLEHHCQSNSIITAAGRGIKGIWGTTEQLLINKNILENPENKHVHRMGRLSKSLWFSHTWVVITFIEISQNTTTTLISNWKPYKTLGYYCIVTWHKWICNYWHY